MYDHTAVYWNVTAARLAFIIAFEHLIFFIIYIMEWLVPDVPRSIKNKIDHERYIDQRERWASKTPDEQLPATLAAVAAISKFNKVSSDRNRTLSIRAPKRPSDIHEQDEQG